MRSADDEESAMGFASTNRLERNLEPVIFNNRLNIASRLSIVSLFFRSVGGSFRSLAHQI